MNFESISQIEKLGFKGFKTIATLSQDPSLIPAECGVYFVIVPKIDLRPNFLLKGSGGYHKGKEPNVDLITLNSKWVDNSYIVYIGKAGGDNIKATLRSRLKQYFSFGAGKPMGHYGGRLIWQLQNSQELIVCWKTCSNPRAEEISYLQEYRNIHSKLPFANLML